MDPRVGVVRDIELRTEPHGNLTDQVLTFRVEREDDQGVPLPPIPVEMRGLSFRGALTAGDWVRLPELPRPGTALEPKTVWNITTRSRFQRKGSVRGSQILAFILFVIVAGAMLWFFLNAVPSAGAPSLPSLP